MNKHTAMEIQLSVYRDLTPAERHEVDQHVATCTACSEKFALFSQQEQLVSDFGVQRQQTLWHARSHQAAGAQPVLQPVRYRSWLATWRFVVWPALQHGQPRVVSGLTFVLMIGLIVTAIFAPLKSLPVAAQPTPVPIQTGAAQADPAAIVAARQGIEAALAREEAARNENDRTRMAEYFDPDASDVWQRAYQARYFTAYGTSDNLTTVRLSVAEVMVEGDFAQVRVRTRWERDGAWATEEGRFYRRVGEQWYLTAPDTEAWGETRVITTTSFRIEYGAVDAAVVETAAPMLEAAYQKLVQTLDLPQARPTAEYPYTPADLPYFHEGKINVAFVPQFIDSWPVTDTTLRLTSPFLDPLLQGSSAVDMPIYSVMARVGSAMVREVRGDSYWHNASIEQWLIEDSLENPPWRGSTFMVEQTQEFLSTYTALQFDDFPTYSDGRWPIVVGNLLMDYMVDTYGRAIIPEFVRGLGTYEAWDELIPAVFGGTQRDFETGWNGWLAARYPEQLQVAAARAGIEASLVIEAEARTNRDPSLMPQFIDPDANAGWQSVFRATTILYAREFQYAHATPGSTRFTLTIEDLQVDNDLARVHIRVRYAADQRRGEQTYHNSFIQGRFYRQVGERWLLTSPEQEMLGTSQELATEHFQFRYHEMDAAAVEAAAPELERMYTRLLDTLELDPSIPAARFGTGREGRIEFELVPFEISGYDLSKPMTTVTSPFFAPLDPESVPSTHLSYAMFQRLLHPLINERLAHEAFLRWGLITGGIRHWIGEDSLVAWSGASTRTVADDFLASVAENYPVRLAELKALDGADDGTAGMGVGFALVEYVVDTYGKQAIVPLLQAMDASSTWEEVIPSVFGVSAGEFETAWNAWLAAHYGL